MGDELAGTLIAHFRVLEKLGEGGMGVVYKASDEKLRRTVALKVLPFEVAGDEDRRRRFLREARAAAAVTHATIATVHEIGEENGRIFIAMELVEGRTLRRVLADGALSVATALRIARDIARGLARAHAKGIVHRDLKPDNVMVTDDFEVKVLDFGVATLAQAPDAAPAQPLPTTLVGASNARAGGEALSQVTQGGRLVGTPAYMAPEQALGLPVDARADVFSFGVLLYEMLCGARPFKASSGVAVLVAGDPVEPPSKRNPQVPLEVEALIKRCLAKDPEDRFASARELLRELEAIEGAPVLSSPGSLRGSVDPAPSARSFDPLPGTGQSTLDAASRNTVEEPSRMRTLARARRKRVLVGAIAAAGALGLAAIAIVGATRETARPATTASTPPPPAKPTGIPLTDAPPPVSSSPEAVAMFRAALQAFRDGNFEAFDAGMRDAIKLDSSFGAGELYVAFAKFHSVLGAVTDAREHLQKAQRLRAQLSPHDQALLDALEPIINREPPQSDETEKRLRASIERMPGDALLLYLLANEERRYDVDKALATYERVLAADPMFMTAIRQKAQTHLMRGDVAEARRLLDQCLAKVPGATGCRNERIWLNQDEGTCAAIEQDAREMIAADPESFRAYEAMALAGVALGRPREAVDELLKQAWQRAPAEVRAREELLANARRAVLDGRFEEARALADKYEAAIEPHPSAAVHAAAARLEVDLAMETGDGKRASKIAESFLRRQSAWSGSPATETPIFLGAERAAGAIDDARYRAARDEFVTAWMAQSSRTRFVRGVAWVLAYAAPARSKDDADEALASLPSYAPVPVGLRTAVNDEAVGRARLFAGDAAGAVAPLRRAASMCNGMNEPFVHVRAADLLGRALEETGDTQGACEEYARVTERWDAKKSVTAAHAKQRREELRCPR